MKSSDTPLPALARISLSLLSAQKRVAKEFAAVTLSLNNCLESSENLDISSLCPSARIGRLAAAKYADSLCLGCYSTQNVKGA